MSGYDVMLSESQERMLLVTPPNEAGPVRRVMDKWEVECRQVGEIVGPQEVLVSDGGRPIAHLPIQRLAEPPQYRLQGSASQSYYQRQRLELAQVPLPEATPGEILLDLLGSPNIASRRPVHRQYDNQVQTNTVAGPGGDAAVLRIKHSNKGIALTIDGNGRYCYLDPYRGGQIVVAEVCRNLTCAGATPLALTDCLNFGNPENPEVYFQLEWCIRGMARACRALGVPVVSGNVSLYNESRGQAVFPTPVVGGLGLLEDVKSHCRSGFPRDGLVVAVLGVRNLRARASDLAGSEYLVRWRQTLAGRPYVNLALEKRVHELCRRGIEEGIVASAHDCSEGGLAVALAECSIQNGIGFNGEVKLPRRWDAALFGERQSRIVVAMSNDGWDRLQELADASATPVLKLGATGGDRFRIGNSLDLPVAELADAWGHGLERAFA